MKLALFDFEFRRSKEKVMDLICVSLTLHNDEGITTHDFWLLNNIKAQMEFKNAMLKLIPEGYYFIAWAAIAEARSLLSLPNSFPVLDALWIDLFLEYRCLQNNDDKLSYGQQLIKGKVTRTYPPKPKWKQTQEDNENNSKPPQSLAATCYKLLNVQIDTDHKEKMRQICIHGTDDEVEAEKTAIMKYCRSDVKYLKMILDRVLSLYKQRLPKKYHRNIRQWLLNRGEFAARTAIMEADGYPYHHEETRNFADNVPKIINDIRGEINELFPDVKPFTFKPKVGLYTWSPQSKTRDWIRSLPDEVSGNWMLTDGGKKGVPDLSLSLAAFTKFFSFSHYYPKDNLGAQFVRMLKTNQCLNGFKPPKKDKPTFWDFVGSDGRVRPYTNIYGSQTSRSQPSSTSFIFLKSAWMRALVQPPSGMAMGGIDYKSQEFLIAGILSGDDAMVNAYKSGDVYLWFGKACGVIPQDGTLETHRAVRDRFKHSVLGIMFRMGNKTLARRIINETGQDCTEDEAQEFIDYFDDIFWKYNNWNKDLLDKYRDDGFLILPDGWIMWGDNKNWRSITNYPIQGFGGVVMKKAVALAQDAGLEIPFTLHDALYVLFLLGKEGEVLDILAQAMTDAFKFYFKGKPKMLEQASNIILEANIWSNDYPEKTEYFTTPNGLLVKQQKIYVDGRSKEEYESFKKYFKRDVSLDLL